MSIRIALAACLAICAADVHAAIIPLAQSRSVRSFGNVTTPDGSDSDGQEASATDFGPFDELVGHAARAGAASSDGFASQTSAIKPRRVTGALSADAFVGAFNFDESADAGSLSGFDVDFQVDAIGYYSLNIGGFASGNGFAMLQLTDPSGAVDVYWDVSADPSPLSVFFCSFQARPTVWSPMLRPVVLSWMAADRPTAARASTFACAKFRSHR